jgi:glycerol-3-phosphate dehydrogenase (NAD(P)+)
MKDRIAIIGDGAWATVCAIMLCQNGQSVRLWSPFAEAAEELGTRRQNRKYLPGVTLPESLEITGDDSQALADADWAVQAIPTQFIRGAWERLAQHCPPGLPICSVAKGIENHTLLRPTQVLLDVLGGGISRVAALSGPSIAPEVARGLPATVVAAGTDARFVERVQALLSRPYFRVYTNNDLTGVELAGATKNVIAVAAGILDGLAMGDNAKAALLTRGLVEITRLGLALGARPETFWGLAGMGDLVTTCISPIGRNRTFGEAVGRGRTVQQALAEAHGVVEGVATTASVVELAKRAGAATSTGAAVHMPITQATYDILFADKSPRDAIAALMNRPLKAET